MGDNLELFCKRFFTSTVAKILADSNLEIPTTIAKLPNLTSSPHFLDIQYNIIVYECIRHSTVPIEF